jgi:hypothetical protein
MSERGFADIRELRAAGNDPNPWNDDRIPGRAGKCGISRTLGLIPNANDHLDELGQGVRLHLLHDASSMELHGAHTHPTVVRERLVGVSANDQGHDLALPGRQARHPRLNLGTIAEFPPDRRVTLDRLLDPVEQILIPERLLKKVDGAGLHG